MCLDELSGEKANRIYGAAALIFPDQWTAFLLPEITLIAAGNFLASILPSSMHPLVAAVTPNDTKLACLPPNCLSQMLDASLPETLL